MGDGLFDRVLTLLKTLQSIVSTAFLLIAAKFIYYTAFKNYIHL